MPIPKSAKIKNVVSTDDLFILYKNTFQQCKVAIEIYDQKGLLIEANDACLNLFGVDSIDEVKGFNLFKDPNLPASLKKDLQKGKPVQYEIEFDFDLIKEEKLYKTTKSGKIYLNVHISAIFGPDGKPGAYLVHVEDLTTHRSYEKELEESESLYHQLFEAESDAIFLIENDTGQILAANFAAAQTYGYTKEELLRMKNTDLSAEPDETRRITETTPIIKDNVVTIPLRYHQKKDGTVFMVEITGRFFEWQGKSVHIAAIRDITERIRSEQKLKDSQENLKLAQEIAMLGFWEYTVATEEVLWTEELYLIYGLKPGTKITLDKILGMTHPDDREMVNATFEKALKDGRPYTLDYRILQPDGTQRYVQGKGRISRDEQNKIVSVMGTGQDITERKKQEEKLRKNRALLDSTQRIGKIGGWEFDTETLEQTWTDETFRIMEIDTTQGEPQIPEGIEFIDPPFRQEAEKVIQQAIRKGTPFDQEWLITTKKGNKRWVHSVARPIIEKGTTKRITGSFQDITTRKIAEEKLIQEKDRAQSYLNLAGVMFVAIDQKGNIILINKKTCQVLEYKECDLLGKNWFDTCIPQEIRSKVLTVFQKLCRGEIKPVEYFENKVLTKTGKERLIAWHNTLIRDEQGSITGTLSSGEDVTELRSAERALKASEEQMREIAEQIPGAIYQFRIDVNGSMTVPFISLGAESLFDLPRHEVTNPVDGFKNLHPDDETMFYESIKTSMEELSPWDHEFRYISPKDKSIRWIKGNSQPHREPDGATVWNGVMLDITLQKQTEEQVREHAAFLDTVMNQSPFAMWISDPGGTILKTNIRLREILNLTDEQILGKYNVLQDQNLIEQGVIPQVKSVFKKKKTTHFTIRWESEKINHFKFSKVKSIWIDVTLFPIVNLKGRLTNVVCQWIDISDRKEAELKLSKNQYMLQKAQQMGLIGTWELDMVNNTLTWTETCYNIFGLSLGQPLTYDLFLSCVHPEDREYVDTQWNKGLKNNDYDLEHRIIVKGKVKYVREKAEISYNESGKPVKAIGFVQDITQRKQAEEAVRNYTEFIETVIEKSPFAMWISDASGTVERINQSLRQSLNISNKQIIGKYNVLKDKNLEKQGVMEQVKAVYNQQKTAHFTIYWSGKETGNNRFKKVHGLWIDVSMFPILNKKNELTHVVCKWADITELKTTQLSLQQSEKKFRTYMESAPVGIFIADQKGRYLDVNTAACKLTGYTKEELLHMNIRDLAAPASLRTIMKMVKTLLKEGKIFSDNGMMRRKDGREINVLISAVTLQDNRMIASCLDITGQKMIEQKLVDSYLTWDNLVQYNPAGIFIYKFEPPDKLILISGNPAAAEQSGIRVNDWINKEFNEIWPEARKRGITDAYLNVMKTGKTFHTEDLYYKDKQLAGAFMINAFRLPGNRLAVAFSNITHQKQAQEILQQHRIDLQRLSGQLMRAQEDERRHLSREMHDELGQALTALNIDITQLKSNCHQDAELGKKLDRMHEIVDMIDNSLVQIQSRLRPGILDDLGLIPALDWQKTDFHSRTGIQCSLKCTLENEELDKDMATMFYRVVQEALTNVSRHAHATKVSVRLSETSKQFKLVIKDNGRGITPEDQLKSSSFGLLGIRERVAVFGGKISVTGYPDKGTSVTVTVPKPVITISETSEIKTGIL